MTAALTIHIVEPGTVRIDPKTCTPMTIDDTAAVIDQETGQAWVTQRTYDLMKDLVANQFTVPAP